MRIRHKAANIVHSGYSRMEFLLLVMRRNEPWSLLLTLTEVSREVLGKTWECFKVSQCITVLTQSRSVNELSLCVSQSYSFKKLSFPKRSSKPCLTLSRPWFFNSSSGKNSKSVFDFLTYLRETGFSFSYRKVEHLHQPIASSDKINRVSKFDNSLSFGAKQNAVLKIFFAS